MPVKMAFNPLPWYLTADGWHPELAPPLADILAAIKRAGYDSVHAEVPAASSPEAYARLLASHGLTPAPGYFQAEFGDPAKRAEIVAAAGRTARDMAALGLDRIFLADQMGVAAPRLATPAQGVEHDPQRFARTIEGIEAVAGAMVAEGVVPCLHLHVGTWIETEEEAAAVLDAIPERLLLVGPDTGHIAWTGADPAAFIGRYRNRIGAVHIKDIRQSVARDVRAQGKGYRDAGQMQLWTEPGRGDIDFDAVFASLAGFDGWFVVEVDIADQPTVEESAAVSARWLMPRLQARAAA